VRVHTARHCARPDRDPRRAHGLDARRGASRIALEPHGVVVVLRPEESPEDIIGAGTVDPGADAAAGSVLRTYGIGAQILRDLGVTRMRVLSAPKQLLGIAAFGLEIAGYEE
jgi:3,4-dihydroxy 2-butanone 4-phosphate synthase/GTP cyclohydrolase II